MINHLRKLARWSYLTAKDILGLGLYGLSRLRYACPARPDRMIWIDPDAINHSIEASAFVRRRKYQLCGQITDGRYWGNIYRLPFRKRLLVSAFQLKFDVESTPADVDPGAREWAEKLSSRRYEAMFEAFKRGEYPVCSWRDRSVDPFYICIGPHGELLFMTGKHRLALAKVARLSRMPVRVSARHIRWQQRRDEIYRLKRAGKLSRLSEIEIDHPDLQDILLNRE